MSIKFFVTTCFLAISALTSTAKAAELEASARIHHCCPGYYSATYADLKFHYVNTTLPWGSTVLIKYGFKSRYGSDAQVVSEWKDLATLQAQASAPFTWDATLLDKFIYGRGGEQESHVQFVVQILLPSGEVIYDKGSDSTWGFYEGYLFPRVQPMTRASLPSTWIASSAGDWRRARAITQYYCNSLYFFGFLKPRDGRAD